MAIKVVDLSKPPRYPKICIFAAPGAGKTTLLGTMPGKGLVIDVPQVEGGAFVLADKANRIKCVSVEEWEEIDDIYWALARGNFDELPGGKPDWIAIDSLTGMQEMAKRKVIRERDRDLGDDPHKVTLREWGDIGQLVGELTYRFCKLPFVVIFVAQERTHGGYDDDPGPARIGPNVIRSALLALTPPMTIMGRLNVTTGTGGRERRTLTVGPPDGDYIVKARALPGRRLPARIRDPHLGQILRYMFADGPKPKADKLQELFS